MNEKTSIAKDFLEKLQDYGLSLAIAGYVAGFVVTNIYLGTYGIANFDIIHARYVLSGIMFLLLAFACLYPSFISWQVFGKAVNIPIKDVVNALFYSFQMNVIATIAVGTPLFVIELVFSASFLATLRFCAMSIGIYLLNCLLISLFYLFIRILIRLPRKYWNEILVEVGKKDSIDVGEERNFWVISIPSAMLFLFLTMVLVYSLWVYPMMPQQVGGGQKIMVDVVYKSSNSKPTLYLLDRTSGTMIFSGIDCPNTTERAIEVASDEVLSVSPNRTGQLTCIDGQTSTITPTAIP